MSIPLVITRGFGNGTFTGTVKDVVLSGYSIGAAVSAPTFTGTIPTITGLVGNPDVSTDLSTYFTDATSYSISPAVEAGWNFDTVTGILTVDTDFGEYGPYIVTGTNVNGSASSNEFYVSITFGLPVSPVGKGRSLSFSDNNRKITKKSNNRVLSVTNSNRKLN